VRPPRRKSGFDPSPTWWKGLGADSEEKHEPMSDIDTVVVDGLKALDLERPIREADFAGCGPLVGFGKPAYLREGRTARRERRAPGRASPSGPQAATRRELQGPPAEPCPR
jgi:hypothetical protein